ncbi:class I SAM-dependent methyltransferase [Amycolatopsis jiangsuensis]|uniref:Ubiquinone/menaquinone biosynthesis C-methylase UbiE n=1 Tax=Amycolatopsis jiangsuensis TaxID=1181879 RepID=A0A840IKP7_9PSEU|nr:class I SAM-dependent methyltransferase [Amycolatopsis jiangsuensis]MBB4682523.1 ubiquinone/menaquinone biosynthesis C-methylase UbiE [Amycolatopsis jiangsuensis]
MTTSHSSAPDPGGGLEAALDRAFGHPSGMLGRLGGRLMALGNAATERRLVDLARLEPDETVLVVGPGPGVGLDAASRLAGEVIGVEPSAEMRALCQERCGDRAELRTGTAARTGSADACVDVVLTVNNVQLWDDRPAAFAELLRVLRPGGRLLLSAHEKWLPVTRHELADEATAAGFTDLQTWTWDPPGFAALAAQLRARRPG